MLNLPASSSPPLPPPGSHGRTLVEHLQEQQEPFALEVYLLEKGYRHPCCSERPCLGSPQAADTCGWPMDACDRLLQKLLASDGLGRRDTRRRCRRLLKSLLAKLLNPKAVRKALNGGKVLHFSGAMDGGDAKTVSSSGLHGGVINPWKWMEEDDSNQLSPVSVLDLSSCGEGSPAHASDAKEEDDISTMEIDLPSKDFTSPFIQFSTSTRRDDLDEPEQLLEEEEEEEEEMVRWKKMERAEEERIRHLALSDISMSKRGWYELHEHAKEISIHIEEAIFEDIKGDVILELLGLQCN